MLFRSPHSEDASLIMRLANALEESNARLTRISEFIQAGPGAPTTEATK